MGEDISVSTSSVGHSSRDDIQTVQQEHVFKEETVSVCTVILDTSDMTLIPIPVEAGEEVVLYDGSQEEVKMEIDVCSDGYQETYAEVYSQPSLTVVETKPRHRHSRQGPHKCNVCSKTFSQVVNLVTHERIHTGEKPFICNVCSKPFSQQPNLWKHMRIHTGEKPYQCTTCKKSFSQQANLTKHTRIHTGERPYSCQFCGQRFTQQANLTKHVRLHTGERPFHCHYCPKTFVQQSNLERHERTHTGVKPFKCKVCQDCFAQNAHLDKHVRTVHKNLAKPYCLKPTDQSKDELLKTCSIVELKSASDQSENNFPKRVGIPVLYCTKTGRIIKRVQ